MKEKYFLRAEMKVDCEAMLRSCGAVSIHLVHPTNI
jgi:hypothetical protein